jgi:hypothetical protein
MSLDARARTAVRELRDVTGEVAPTSGPQMVEQRLETRRRTRQAALAACCLAVVAAALGFAGGRLEPGRGATPVAPASPAPTAGCPDGAVTCLGERAYRVALPLPVEVTVPASFRDDLVATATTVEFYQDRENNDAGVTILEDAIPVAPDGSPTVRVGGGAAAAADWLTSRPFVRAGERVGVTISGLPGYRVDVVHRPGTPLPASRAMGPVALTFASGSWSAAVSPELRHTTYYLLDAPDGSLVVIWAWGTDGTADSLPAADELVRALRLG